MKFIKIINWEEHQHYKDRNPIWIKLYNSILDNYEFSCLQDASKLLLIHLWLLASKTENKIPNDVGWLVRKLQITFKQEHINALISNGFIECYQDDSKMLASCYNRVEKSREEEKREDICSEQTSCSKQDKEKISFNKREVEFENITDKQLELWHSAYPAVDLNSELNAMCAWLDANPKNCKSNYTKFITNWLKRSQDRARRV